MIRPQIGIPRFPWHGDETGVAMRLGRCDGSRRANASEMKHRLLNPRRPEL